MKTAFRIPLLCLALLGGACSTTAPAPKAGARSADDFFRNVAALCGKAYSGRVVVDTPPAQGPDPFAGKALVMHVRECDGDTLRIPFMVGDDRSRTWVLTRTSEGLRLKHDHRHEDGNEDALTMYGGDTVDAGTAQRQAFPVDAESRELFTREKREASLTNVWTMEIEPDERFVYELARPGRSFRVEFDLSRPVPAPPPPWGAH